jgi:hypothetical protein
MLLLLLVMGPRGRARMGLGMGVLHARAGLEKRERELVTE